MKYLAMLLLTVACHAAAGQLTDLPEQYRKAAAEGKSTFVVDIDNDSLLLRDEDGFYTSGLRLSREYALRDSSGLTVFGWRLGQELYSPSDINLPPAQVGPPQHPYAGWLYGGFFKRTHRADGTSHAFGVDIGCIGPCAGGRWTQTNLHRLLNQPLPQGWSRQIRNELGVVLYGDIAPVRWSLGPSVDLTPRFHGRIGNIHTDAGAGLTLRAGRLNGLPDQDTLHAFFRLDGRAVAYNATMQGGAFSDGDPHTVKPKRLTGGAEAGMVWRAAPFGVSLSVVRRGNEIRDLPNGAGMQNFLRLQLSYIP